MTKKYKCIKDVYFNCDSHRRFTCGNVYTVVSFVAGNYISFINDRGTCHAWSFVNIGYIFDSYFEEIDDCKLDFNIL